MMDFFEFLFQNSSLYNTLDALFKMIVAALLSGFIGYEREHSHRPAGFRTHILVCLGSALIMSVSGYIFREYRGITDIDPTRMAAQVISGIGFLGAGTILREGFTVKGLTTAASLWAVSCIGITVGAGYYGEAVVATLVIYLTLNLLRKFIIRRKMGVSVYIEAENINEEIRGIGAIANKYNVNMFSLEIIDSAANTKFKRHKNTTVLKATVFPNNDAMLAAMLDSIRLIDGVVDLYLD